ncbi:MAG: sensor histidine kinase [Acidimicrobiia bacterium]
MSGSRVRLAIVLMAPAVLMAFVVMVVTVALLASHEPWTDARTGIAQVGDDLVVVVAEEASLDGLIDSGLLAPALALFPALVVAWVVAGRVRRVVAQARAEVEAADVERRSRTQEVVHELRTPLAVMGTNLELAALEAGHEPGTAGYIEAARRAVSRMARTVDDLAGHGGLAVEQGNGPVDLADLAESAVAEHFGPARARGVNVELIGASLTTVPSVDPAAVRIAIGNFLSNAVRMAPQGSSVGIDWGRLDGWAWIAVIDEGPGLAPHLHARVFERGWQGHHERERGMGNGGAGLGLTIARQLTEAQGGAVTVESEEGGGAVFTVWLPVEIGADPKAVIAPDRIHAIVRPWLEASLTA